MGRPQERKSYKRHLWNLLRKSLENKSTECLLDNKSELKMKDIFGGIIPSDVILRFRFFSAENYGKIFSLLSLIKFHIFREEFNRVLRILTIYSTLCFQLLLEGLLMYGFEKTNSGQSSNAQQYFNDYKNNYF